MGASLVYLNEPNTEIEQEKGENDYLSYAAGSMQGWRLNMVSNISNFFSLENLSSIIKIKLAFINHILKIGRRTHSKLKI